MPPATRLSNTSLCRRCWISRPRRPLLPFIRSRPPMPCCASKGRAADADAAFANTDGVVRGRFEVPRVNPAPLETRGVLASYDPGDDRITLWTSTQVPHTIRDSLAQVMGLSPDSIRVVAPEVGGGFGQKHQLFPEEVGLSLSGPVFGAARAVGRGTPGEYGGLPWAGIPGRPGRRL